MTATVRETGQFTVRENITFPHPDERSVTVSNRLGQYLPTELTRLVDSYRDVGYTAKRVIDPDNGFWWILTNGPITIGLECTPYDPVFDR